MRRDPQPACSTDTHSFDAVEQPVHQLAAVDPHLGNQCFPVVFETRAADRTPRRAPSEQHSFLRPKPKPDAVLALTNHRCALARNVHEEREARPKTNWLGSAGCEQRGDAGEPGGFRQLPRRFVIVDPGAKLRIRARVEQAHDREPIALGNGHMQRSVVVDAALIRVGAKRKQQTDDFIDIIPLLRTGLVPRAGQCRNQGREAVICRCVRVGADLEKRSNETERTVIDRINQTRTECVRHRPVGDQLWIADGLAQCLQVAALERFVYALQPSRLPAPLLIGFQSWCSS
jgi:hypothetical protein